MCLFSMVFKEEDLNVSASSAGRQAAALINAAAAAVVVAACLQSGLEPT